MIESPQPVNLSVHLVADLWNGSLNYMQHALRFSINAINHARFAKRPCIIWLAASGWIKRGAIQSHGHGTLISFAQTNYARIKFKQTRIVVVESFSCTH